MSRNKAMDKYIGQIEKVCEKGCGQLVRIRSKERHSKQCVPKNKSQEEQKGQQIFTDIDEFHMNSIRKV